MPGSRAGVDLQIVHWNTCGKAGRVTVTKVRTLVTEILVLQPKARRLHSESHNVVTAVDVHYFTGDTGTRIRSQEYSGRADFIYVYVALQGRALRV